MSKKGGRPRTFGDGPTVIFSVSVPRGLDSSIRRLARETGVPLNYVRRGLLFHGVAEVTRRINQEANDV